jgi:hypothetical protein
LKEQENIAKITDTKSDTSSVLNEEKGIEKISL